MKGSLAVLGHIGGQKAAALLVDGKLNDFLIDPAQEGTPLPGAIYRAKVGRQVKGQGGVFVDLPDGETGFLRQAKGLAPGQTLLVQVTGHAEAGKAIPVTSKVLFKSRFAIITPNAPGFNISRSIRDEDTRENLLAIAHEVIEAEDSFGLIVRSSAADADNAEIADDISETYSLARAVMQDAGGAQAELLIDGPDAHHLAWREWDKPDQIDDDQNAFDHHEIDTALMDFTRAHVALGANASMYVEPTRALVAVDVNTGGDTSMAAGLKANLAAAKELPGQLRVRGLGGQIVIDFAPVPKKDRRQIEQTLRSAFRQDSIETALVGWTPLGHFELQRKRERRPLIENLPK